VSIQPDLFGDYDRDQEQAQRWRQPATCPACGTQEPSGYLLRQNHGADPDQPGICGFPPGGTPPTTPLCASLSTSSGTTSSTPPRNRQREQLTRDKTRGRQLGLRRRRHRGNSPRETRQKTPDRQRHH
jgi:hypothetical protein